MFFILFGFALSHPSGDISLPINEKLGVPGFPDCDRANPSLNLTVREAANDLICHQNEGPSDAIQIATVGDSITAGVCSTGGNAPYPAQLQILLDNKYGEGKYKVTNLGACGSTMLINGDSPFWKRPQFNTLINSKWDIVTIMLGTNDAKDPSSGGPNNWQHDCGGANDTTLAGCTFAKNYASMIKLVRTLGKTAPPKVFAMIPPPLMQQAAYGMNQTVINSVYPKLVPMIGQTNKVDGIVDFYSTMGGVADWKSKFPKSCTRDSTWPSCKYWCDAQSCDQCHPNDDGYAHLAPVLMKEIGL